MKSMTGFGSTQYSSKSLELSINIRAVNGRYLDIRFHLPREYASFESEFKKLIGQSFRRGTVDVYVGRRLGSESSGVKVVAQSSLAKKWVSAYKKLAKELKLPTDLRLENIGELSQILRVEEESQVSAQEKKQAITQLKKSLKACDDERKREGDALAKELKRLLTQLNQSVQKMGQMREKANSELQKRFATKLKSLGFEGVVEEDRMAQEVAILVDKSDVTEEMARLKEHISSCGKLVSQVQPQGKKMDFYSQELLREVNTIGSKSQLSQLTQEVVNAKAIIERFREQVQNVE